MSLVCGVLERKHFKCDFDYGNTGKQWYTRHSHRKSNVQMLCSDINIRWHKLLRAKPTAWRKACVALMCNVANLRCQLRQPPSVAQNSYIIIILHANKLHHQQQRKQPPPPSCGLMCESKIQSWKIISSFFSPFFFHFVFPHYYFIISFAFKCQNVNWTELPARSENAAECCLLSVFATFFVSLLLFAI